MQKNFVVFFLSIFFFTLTLQPVKALDVSVHPDGTVYFYDTRVLGDSNEVKGETESSSKGLKDGKPENGELKKVELRQIGPITGPTHRSEQSKPLKILPTSQKSQIRLQTENGKPSITIEKKTLNATGSGTSQPRFETKETMDSRELKLELPAANRGEGRPEKKSEDFSKDQEQEIEKSPVETQLQERRSRKDENIEIRTNEEGNGDTGFQVESRNIKANLKGANIVVDPITNDVTIVTPNGQEHVLNHLPDQAIEQMKKAGLIEGNTDNSQPEKENEVEIKTQPDGTVAFQLKQKKHKKIFGFLPREVETQVELNDDTGEVTETAVPSTNIFAKFLDSLAK